MFLTIYQSVSALKDLEKKSIESVARYFSDFSNQEIPTEIIEKWKFTGLGNEYFLTSDFLIQHGFRNLLNVFGHIHIYNFGEHLTSPTEMPEGYRGIIRFIVEQVNQKFLLTYQFWYINRHDDFSYAGEFRINNQDPAYGSLRITLVKESDVQRYYLDNFSDVQNLAQEFVKTPERKTEKGLFIM